LTLRTHMIDTFLQTKDALKEQIGAYREGREPSAEAVAHICAILQELAREAQDGAEAPAPVAAPPVQAAAVAPAAAAANARLRVRFLRLAPGEAELLREEMSNLGTVVAETRTEDGLALSLETTCSADDIVAVCCFVIDADQIEVA